MIYLFRNPADSLVSYYHYHLREGKMRTLMPYGPDEFCRRYVAGWCEHVRVVLGYKLQCATDVHFVRYEDLLSDGPSTLRGIVDYLDLPASDELLRQSLEKNSFANHRAAEKDQPKNGEFFFRKGYAGAGVEEIRPETREFIDQKTRRIFAEAIDQVDGGKAKRTTPISISVNLAFSGIASMLTSLPLSSLAF